MPITNTFGRMPLDRVWVERSQRQRRDPDPHAGGLIQSVALRGVLMPVILEEVPDARGYHMLYAGERRYAASLELGLEDIPFRFARSPSAAEMQIIEFEENAKRKDLTWQETCQSVVGLHALLAEANPSQTFEHTAAELGWADGSDVAKYHFIAESWHDDAVRACATKNEAYNLLQRRQKRARANQLEEWLGAPGAGAEAAETEDDSDSGGDNSVADSDSDKLAPNKQPSGGSGGGSPQAAVGSPSGPSSIRGPLAPSPAPATAGPVIAADFTTWARGYAGPKFNLIHCDFPYGISLGENSKRTGSNSLHREEHEVYADGAEVYEALLETFVTEFDRFASESCHVMFWYSNRYEVEAATRAAFARIGGFKFLRYPLVWHKSDNAGFMTPGHPRHIYETCLVGGRGDRPIVRYVSDTYSSPTDNSLHMSAKPEPMLRYFMGMFCDEHSRVLDPTCGSASALRAAEALKAERVLGLELNPTMVATANAEILRARALRRVAGALAGAEGGAK